MRGIALAVAAILAAGWPCGPAYAASDVLVPSDNSSAPDDLGYVTQTPDSGQPKDGSSESAPAPAESTPDLPALDPGASSASPPPDTPAQEPAEGRAAPAPSIIEVPAMAAQSTPENADLPNTLRIDIGDSSWGINDKSAVHNTLGIAADDVPEHCHLSAGGMANSSGLMGMYNFDTGLSQETLLRYDGKLTGVSVRLQALCDPVPLPAGSRYVVKVGDDYSVFLAQISCSKPPQSALHLIVQYAGNGSGKCVYE